MTIRNSQKLGSPMYFFIFYLSFADACFSLTTAPRLIADSVSEKKAISFNECMTQIFAFHFFGYLEILVLVLMFFDRYVAICKPVQYTAIMSQSVCGTLVKLAWMRSCIHSSAQILLALKIPFCGPNVIDHYFCDMQPLLKPACVDTYVINLLIVFNSGTICMVSFLLLLISYIFILHSLSNYSTERRRRALSTCTSHIIIIVLFFVPCIYIYACPLTVFPVDKMVAVFYTIVTPLLHPLIFTLRNAEVKQAMRKLWCNKVWLKMAKSRRCQLLILSEFKYNWIDGKEKMFSFYCGQYKCVPVGHLGEQAEWAPRKICIILTNVSEKEPEVPSSSWGHKPTPHLCHLLWWFRLWTTSCSFHIFTFWFCASFFCLFIYVSYSSLIVCPWYLSSILLVNQLWNHCVYILYFLA